MVTEKLAARPPRMLVVPPQLLLLLRMEKDRVVVVRQPILVLTSQRSSQKWNHFVALGSAEVVSVVDCTLVPESASTRCWCIGCH